MDSSTDIGFPLSFGLAGLASGHIFVDPILADLAGNHARLRTVWRVAGANGPDTKAKLACEVRIRCRTPDEKIEKTMILSKVLETWGGSDG